MRITKSEEYGLRLVMSLAVSDGQLSIRELAEREGLPETTVAKITARLRKAGVICAARGRNGGYSLAGAAHEMTLARVVEAFEEKIYDPSFCGRMSPGNSLCTHSSRCGLRPVWRSLTELIGGYLSGITVADIINRRAGATAPAAGCELPLAIGHGV